MKWMGSFCHVTSSLTSWSMFYCNLQYGTFLRTCVKHVEENKCASDLGNESREGNKSNQVTLFEV